MSELCSKVLPEEMKDVEWNIVRTGNPVYLDIAEGLMAVGISHELGEKTGSESIWVMFGCDLQVSSVGNKIMPRIV